MKTIKINLPKSWDELSTTQLEGIVSVFNSGKKGIYFDLAIYYVLMDVKWWQFKKRRNARFILSDIPLSEMKKHYSFIYEENNRTVFPAFMKTKKETFYAPGPRLNNLTAEEFAITEGLHAKWFKERDRKVLEYLAAVLYTTAPLLRPDFQVDLLEEKAKLFRKVPLKRLLAVELVYAGCKNNIVRRFPHAFPKSYNPSKGEKQYGFGKVILEMSGGKFSEHEKAKKAKLYTFLEVFESNLKPKTK